MQENMFLSLGSNIGDRAQNLIDALSFLHSNGIVIRKISSLYETSPIGPKQRNFYNICIKARSYLRPIEILDFVKNIEFIMGRKKTRHWSPRAIDIDILFLGNQKIESSRLSIPHKEIKNRLFVLRPLNEIAPDFYNEVFGLKVKEFLQVTEFSLANQKVKSLGPLFRKIK